MTGLPEYRNGGLLFDLGLLEAKHNKVTGAAHRPEDEVTLLFCCGFFHDPELSLFFVVVLWRRSSVRSCKLCWLEDMSWIRVEGGGVYWEHAALGQTV